MSGTPRIALAALLAASAVVLGACGGDDDETTTSTTTTSTTTTTDEADCEEEIAHIDPTSGESGGLDPDCREGTPPPPQETEDLKQAAEAANCELQLDLPDEGNTHVTGSKSPTYETQPPTSGDHDPVPLADGVYAETPDPRYFVHSLEHGRVAIEYQPSLPETDQLALKGVVDDDPDGMLMFPWEDMPYEVAATAWTNLIGCDSYSPEALDAIQAFRDEFRGNGPEAIPL